MDITANILKVVAIAAALVALRFLLRRFVGRGSAADGEAAAGGGPGQIARAFLPALLTGGPMFVALPAAFGALRAAPDKPFLFYMALGGAVWRWPWDWRRCSSCSRASSARSSACGRRSPPRERRHVNAAGPGPIRAVSGWLDLVCPHLVEDWDGFH